MSFYKQQINFLDVILRQLAQLSGLKPAFNYDFTVCIVCSITAG